MSEEAQSQNQGIFRSLRSGVARARVILYNQNEKEGGGESKGQCHVQQHICSDTQLQHRKNLKYMFDEGIVQIAL